MNGRTRGSLALAVALVLTGAGASEGRTIAGDGARVELNCAGAPVVVAGRGNTVRLAGRCPLVTVSGDGNVVTVVSLGRLLARGDDNTVVWLRALRGARPEVVDAGTGNRLRGR